MQSIITAGLNEVVKDFEVDLFAPNKYLINQVGQFFFLQVD